MNSIASHASKPGPAMRNQLFSACRVQRMTLCAPSARREATATAFGVQFAVLLRRGDQPDAFGLGTEQEIACQQCGIASNFEPTPKILYRIDAILENWN